MTVQVRQLELRGASSRRTFWFVFRRERAHCPTVRELIETGRRLMRAHRGGAPVRALPSG